MLPNTPLYRLLTDENIDQIDRGYQDIDSRLNAIGAKIKRIDD